MKIKLLIVEDQFIEANNLRKILIRAAYEVCSIARSVPLALKIIEEETPDLVLLDIFLKGDLTGIDLAKSLNEKKIPFVFISANCDKQILDAAKYTKPYGFLVKPFREKDVLVMLDVALYLHEQSKEFKNNDIKSTRLPSDSSESKNMMSESENMLDVFEQVKIVSPTNSSVLILGESGTGKELIARDIHRLSLRNSKPLIIVNCATLPTGQAESELFGHEEGAFAGANNKRIGKFEQADQGTIFLDEIGALHLDLQVKFLRVLQEQEIEPNGGQAKKINVRVIASTNRNLEDEIVAERFRIDLYYRLSAFPILLPPLRERKKDILLLANHFINIYAQNEGKTIKDLSDSVIQKLVGYNWPGNVRELENLIGRSVLLAKGDTITEIQLPAQKKNATMTPVESENEVRQESNISSTESPDQEDKKSFLVFKHNKYITIPTDTIAFFFVKYESSTIMCFDRQEYSVNDSLDQIHMNLPGKQFYRLNRQYLISFKSIKEVEHYFARKLLVTLSTPAPDKLIVSKDKATGFLQWLENR